MSDEIIIRDHTMADVEDDKIINLIQKCYYGDGWRKENWSKVNKGQVPDEKIREMHRELVNNKQTKNILGERNGKIVCDMTGILRRNLYYPSIKEVDIFVWVEDRDENTGDAPKRMLDIMIEWAKDMRATSLKTTFALGWKQSDHLQTALKERYGFEPLEVIYFKPI